MTGRANRPTLEVKGDIFMSEPGQREQPPKQLEPASGAGGGSPPEKPPITTSGEANGNGEDSGEQAPNIKTGPAKWKNKDNDQPIVVTEYAGKGPDGKDYVNIEGSETSVPLDEIEYPQEEIPAAGAGGGEPPEEPPEVVTAEEPGESDGGEDRGEIKEYIKALNKLLSDEEVRRVLISDNPDFDQLPQLEEFIRKYMSPADRSGKIGHFARFVTGKDNDFSSTSKKLIFERLLEKIIGMTDKTPDRPYHADSGNIYVSSNLQELLEVARANLAEDFPYFGNLAYVREVAHELNRNLKYGEQYKKYVTESLRTGGLNFMHNRIAGVSAVIREYERISSYRIRQVKTWFSEKDIRAIDSEVEEMIKDHSREEMKIGNRKLSDWEIERALKIGKILFAGSQRLAAYAAAGDLPHDALLTGRFGSVPYEYIARSLFPFKMTSPRFFAGAGGSRRYMERIFEEQKKDSPWFDEKEKKSKLYSLFGLDERTILMDSCGAMDSQTQAWRAEMMFLGAITMNIDGEHVNLLDYLNEFAVLHGGKSGDPKDQILGGRGVDEKERPNFSKDVRNVVMGQRLYLSNLARYGNFDDVLKADIWQKISLLTPSTIASVVPRAIGKEDEKIWEQMRYKLYAAENKRINNDSVRYRKGLTNDDLKGENEKFSKVLETVKKDVWTEGDFDTILEYMGMGELKLEIDEKKLLKKIITAGIEESEKLGRAKLPFAFAIVDAPEVAWSKTEDGTGGLEDEDLLRILLSDQESFSKAWTEMNGLIENPTAGLREHTAKAVEGIGMVIGRKSAQEIIRPFIIAYIKMASTTPSSEWIGDFQKLLRQATSEMERYYRNSHISWDAKEREITLEGMSQDGSISDDISEGNISDLDKVKKKTKSTRRATFLRMARLIIMLLGPEAGISFLKLFVPQDLLNSLQKK